MNGTLVLEGNCGNILFLHQKGLLPAETAAAVDAMLATYARRLCFGVGFGQSNIIKALTALRVGIADKPGYCRSDAEAARIDETIARAQEVPEVIQALEEYGFDRGAAQKSPELVLREVLDLLLLARSRSAHLWVWAPRLKILRALFQAAGAPVTTTTSPRGYCLHTARVADLPFIPPQDGEPTAEFGFIELQATMTPVKRARRTVLFVASIPQEQGPIRFDVELRKILHETQRADPGLYCVPELAARPEDLERALLENHPSVFHFAGHATPRGLLLQDDGGSQREMSYAWLAAVLANAGGVDCVVLNACHTENGISALTGVARHVIALPNPWDDDGAVEFSHAFYLALARATPIPKAFRAARERAASLGIPAEDLPIHVEHSGQGS